MRKGQLVRKYPVQTPNRLTSSPSSYRRKPVSMVGSGGGYPRHVQLPTGRPHFHTLVHRAQTAIAMKIARTALTSSYRRKNVTPHPKNRHPAPRCGAGIHAPPSRLTGESRYPRWGDSLATYNSERQATPHFHHLVRPKKGIVTLRKFQS